MVSMVTKIGMLYKWTQRRVCVIDGCNIIDLIYRALHKDQNAGCIILISYLELFLLPRLYIFKWYFHENFRKFYIKHTLLFLICTVEKLYTHLHDPENELVTMEYENMHYRMHWGDAGAF